MLLSASSCPALQIVAPANALQIAPSELVKLPIPAPANGDEETVVKAVRRALIAVSRDDPAGQVVPADVLRARVETLVAAQRHCEHEQVGRELPALIRDLHSSMAPGREVGELLAVAVLLHVQGSHAFLQDMGAPADLRWQAATLARQAAREHGGSEVFSALLHSARRTGCWQPGLLCPVAPPPHPPLPLGSPHPR